MRHLSRFCSQRLLCCLFLLAAFWPIAALAQPAAFPDDWSYWMSDPDENGTSNDYRDVQAVYYSVDSDYLYLRLQNRCDCGWSPGEHGRYKWFIDTIDGDAYLQGGSFRVFEFLLMLEDHVDNDEDPLLHEHNNAEHDLLGELYLLDDLSNIGVDVRWASGSEPHPYMVNTPVGDPSPSPYWRAERGEGVGGFGGSQSAFGADIGYMMEGQFVDMYVSRAVLGNPDTVCMYWATDQENNNLDQAPHQDRPTAELCFELELNGSITVNKHVEPEGNATASFPFGGDLGAFNLDVVDGADASADFLDLVPGSYNLFESLGSMPAGFTLASIVCDDPGGDSTVDLATGNAFVELAAGEHVSCTFTNVETPVEAGTIVIVKHSLPHDPQSFNFTSDVPGFEAFSLSDTGDAHTLTMTGIEPGAYSVTEGALPNGWHADGLVCVDPDNGSSPLTLTDTLTASIDLDEGEVVTCTFTNGQDASVAVAKQTDPDGSLDEFDFSGSFGDFTLADGGILGFIGLDVDEAEAYTVTESTLPPGWLLQQISCEGTGGASIDLGARSVSLVLQHGEDAVCTFHNAAPGTLVIYKQTVPDGLVYFDFTDGFQDFSAAPGDPHVLDGLLPSVIEVTELLNTPQWMLEDLFCVDPDGGSSANLDTATVTADVDAGETVECVFVNAFTGVPVPALSRWSLALLVLVLAGGGWLAARRRLA